jgi:CRP-like cAMP-binding protein
MAPDDPRPERDPDLGAELGGQLTEGERAELHRIGHRRRVKAGTPIFVEGTHSDHVVIVLSGRVKVFSTARDGTESVLAIRGPGALLGDLSAIDGAPRSASVTALEPVELLSVGAERFSAFLRARPRLMWLLVRMLTSRLRDADRKRIEFGVHDTLGRVAHRLVELAERHGEPGPDGIRITVPLTQDELASWVGASREATAKALRSLRERGWLRTQRRTITVLDLDELRRRAG